MPLKMTKKSLKEKMLKTYMLFKITVLLLVSCFVSIKYHGKHLDWWSTTVDQSFLIVCVRCQLELTGTASTWFQSTF